MTLYTFYRTLIKVDMISKNGRIDYHETLSGNIPCLRDKLTAYLNTEDK